MSADTRSTTGTLVPTRLSIIILSRHRPRALALCLAALERQDHPDFELVLVADAAALDQRPDLNIKRIAFDQPNVSAGRNLGIAQASGQVIAFIDDDALAPPNWARRICAGFADPRVVAATGFTRGPDGLSWQARGERIAPSGESFAIPVVQAVSLAPRDGCPVSTLGTNCAFRRDALLAIGGFDPAFRYFLDESDVNLRMAARFPDALTAIIPDTEVIHGIAEGPLRAAQGVPRSLTDIGRSAVIFAQRYRGNLPPVEMEQRLRLVRHVLAGRLGPLGVGRLMTSLRQGMAEALRGSAPQMPMPMEAAEVDFLRLNATPHDDGTPMILAGWHWQAADLRARAAQAIADGRSACLLLLTPTILPHELTLTTGGWWEQRGGLWGRVTRAERPAARLRRSRKLLVSRFETAMIRRFATKVVKSQPKNQTDQYATDGNQLSNL